MKERAIKGNLLMTRKMERVFSSGKMGASMMDNGKKENNMGLVYIRIQNWKERENGKMEREFAGI
jgi:hypothetical protein